MNPEILAPAGSPACLPAAVAGGADAVYLGLRHFNARGRAENFRKADLPRYVAYLHRHGLKCYVVLNTLVHDDEHPKALDLAWHARLAGVDAAIVQDLGLWRRLSAEVPGLPLHASTQMTVHHPSQIAVLADLGARRVILARELALPEIAACAATARAHGIEIEHFVHGALCYAFSGQCLMSNFAGCRSANRGTCAQNCRFVYASEAAAPDTVLSMRDLSLIGRVGELAEAGVASLKIEGRLKGPDYVFAVSRAVREARDAWAADRAPDPALAAEPLTEVFARPFTDAPLDRIYGPASRLHRADPLRDRPADGVLEALDRRTGVAVARLDRRPEPGVGFALPVGMYQDGFLVTAVDPLGDGRWRLRVRVDARGPRVPVGTPLFRNRDQARTREAETAMAAVPLPDAAQGGLPVTLRLSASPGQPLVASAIAADGRRAEVVGDEPVAQASRLPLNVEQLVSTFAALGGSGWQLAQLDAELAPDCFVPAAALKRVRRALLAALDAQPPGTPPAWTVPDVAAPRRRITKLWVAVGSHAAAEAALAAGAARIAVDTAADAAGLPAGTAWLRAPAVGPPPADSGLPVLAGHLGSLVAAHTAGRGVAADVFLNCCSTATLQALAELGAADAVLSYELSGREVARLAARVADLGIGLAIPVHGRVPAMLTRQDHGLPVGGRRLITASAQEGGLPYELERRAHDTVVWEARRLCAPEPARATAGLVDWWLLELADLAPAAVAQLTTAYAGLLAGTVTATEVEHRAALHAPHGLFPGHLVRGARELDDIAESVLA